MGEFAPSTLHARSGHERVIGALVHNLDVGCVHPWRWSSGDALGHGHAKLGHDVDDLAASRGFGLLC